MEYLFNEEQKMIQLTCRRLVAEKIAPEAAKLDESGEFPKDTIELLAKQGLLGIVIPERYGGSQMGYLAFCLAIEEISKGCASTADILGAHALGCFPLVDFGTEEQKRRYLPSLSKGEKLAAFALTEPETGSDFSGTRTTALREGNSYIINGTKRFITNGGEADFYVVFASTDPKKRLRGLSAFIVEKGEKGFEFGKKENKMGLRAAPTRELLFSECRVPERNLLGSLEMGSDIALSSVDQGKPLIGAQALGIAEAAFTAAFSYAQQRVQFGKPIIQHEGIQFMFSDMATEINAARLLVYHAAILKDKGLKFIKEAAMAKLYSSEMAHRVVHKALQIHGGYGYMKDYPIERYYRDQRITEIYEGTSEMQRLVVITLMLKGQVSAP